MKKITALLLSIVFMCLPLFSCTGSGGLDGLTNETTGGNTPVVPDIDGSQIAITTDNFSVDIATVSYFFNGVYNTDKAQYGSYMTMMGLDTTKPLKDQKYGESTWFDFYLDSALEQLEANLLFCEYARSVGLELTEEDGKTIDGYMEKLDSQATMNNTTTAALIAEYYGPLVTPEVFKSCLELETLGTKGYDHYMNGLSYPEERYEEYYSENKKMFDYVGVYKYAVSANITEDATEEEETALLADAKAKAENLCAAESEEDFKARLGDLIRSRYTGENELSDSAVEARVASYYTSEYTVNDLIGAGFDENCDFAPGSYVIVENDTTYTVFYTVSSPARSDDLIADMRYILFSVDNYETEDAAREKANEVHELFLAGDKTVDSFTALVKEHSDEEYNKETGALIEGLEEGTLDDVEIEKWLFDRSRVQGDTAVVNTSAGIMIVYFEQFSGEKWEQQVGLFLKSEDYAAKLEELRNTVTYTKIDEVISQYEA